LFCILKVSEERIRIRIRIPGSQRCGSASKCHGSPTLVIRYKSVSPLPHLVSYTRTVSRPYENTRAAAACPDWQRISGTRRRCGRRRRAFHARCSMPGTILPPPPRLPPPPPARGESPGQPGSGHPQSPRCCCPTPSDAANIWNIVLLQEKLKYRK
jgi:hypothetical protein